MKLSILLKKPVIIGKHEIENYLSKVDYRAKISVTAEARRKTIEDSLRERKIDFNNYSIDEFVSKAINLSDIDSRKND